MSVSIELVDRATVKVNAIPDAVRGRLRVVLVRDAKDLAQIIRGKISGPILKVRSGKLLSSIEDELYETPNGIWARVYSTDPKAAILEWGGHTKPHMIYPVNAKALRWMAAGGAVFAKRVNHPGSLIPEFAYMRTSLDELKERLLDDMVEAIG